MNSYSKESLPRLDEPTGKKYYYAQANSFKAIDKDIIEETKMVSNINLKIFIYVFFPITFKYFITSILTVMGLGFKVLVMAEVFGSTSSTLGGLLQTYRSVGDMESIFALTIILIIIVSSIVNVSISKNKEEKLLKQIVANDKMPKITEYVDYKTSIKAKKKTKLYKVIGNLSLKYTDWTTEERGNKIEFIYGFEK